jgi:hypothetical protein
LLFEAVILYISSLFGSLQLTMCLRRPSRWWVEGSTQKKVGEWACEYIVTGYESCVDVCSRLVEVQEAMGTSVETERPIVYFVYMVQPLLRPCSVSAVDVILRICASLYLHCPRVLVPFWLEKRITKLRQHSDVQNTRTGKTVNLVLTCLSSSEVCLQSRRSDFGVW